MSELLNSLTQAEKIISDAVNGGADISLGVGEGLVAVMMVALNKFERHGIDIGRKRCIKVIAAMEKNANESLDTLREAGGGDGFDVQRGRSIALHQALGAIESSRPKVLARFVSEEQAALKQIEDGMKGLTDA